MASGPYLFDEVLFGSFADWQTAGVRIERFDKLLLPLARERVAAGLAAYRGGRGELASVLEARRAEIEAGRKAMKRELDAITERVNTLVRIWLASISRVARSDRKPRTALKHLQVH